MYGAAHTGTGGDEVARAIGRELELRPGMNALEIASGLGGSAFLIAQARPLPPLTNFYFEYTCERASVSLCVSRL